MKYLNKSFTVYSNYRTDKCDHCGKESNYYVQSKEGKLCTQCYSMVKKENELRKLIKEINEQ
jgi:CRISPR/Cas system-associated protein Cas10 (large subunit of type III CRISPR-Cas system)